MRSAGIQRSASLKGTDLADTGGSYCAQNDRLSVASEPAQVGWDESQGFNCQSFTK